jgi:hypothetical protein
MPAPIWLSRHPLCAGVNGGRCCALADATGAATPASTAKVRINLRIGSISTAIKALKGENIYSPTSWGRYRLVVLIPSLDLFDHARDLFVAANDGKAPAIDGRGKLAERDRRLFGPSRSAPNEERL